ncbi:MAG: sulfurtransferase TusA family protein [Pseudomonadota bacterium]|nr:sulfurtransferase TusA family protein [Pseudomonadota bacterium]
MGKKQEKLDLIGFKCPIPVLKLAQKIKKINVGDTLVVKVDDPKADNDIEELVKNINIKIMNKIKTKKILTFHIQKIS